MDPFFKTWSIAWMLALSAASLEAVVIQVPTLDGVQLREEKRNAWIDPSMQKYIDPDVNVINPVKGRLYQFDKAKIGSFYLYINQNGRWNVINQDGDNECSFNILIYPSRCDATQAAIDGHMIWDTGAPPNENDTCVETENGISYYRARPEDHPQVELVHSACMNGVLLQDILWRTGGDAVLSLREQKDLLKRILEVVLSGKPHRQCKEEMRQIRERKREEYNLMSYPKWRMNNRINYADKKLYADLPEGDETFVHPRIMWNRPSLKWFGQFQNSFLEKSVASWNKRGDYQVITFPATEKQPPYRCTICIAHATSEYHALRFLEGIDSEPMGGLTIAEGIARIRERQVNVMQLGEHNISLKPQLNAYGALIPNSEESDISFVRNNTAVRVVADRPDVSVLWIARKIDEELIAAGKGEPPTWTPPAPAKKKGARNVPATSGKPIKRPVSKVPAASGSQQKQGI